MIIGLGIDLTELQRIKHIYEKYESHFLKKFLTESEISLIPINAIPFLAGRFAAKEAAVKALGIGFSEGISPKHIEITNNPLGKPQIRFMENAQKKAISMGVEKIHLSITHERQCACAIVILENVHD